MNECFTTSKVHLSFGVRTPFANDFRVYLFIYFCFSLHRFRIKTRTPRTRHVGLRAVRLAILIGYLIEICSAIRRDNA